MNTPLDRQALHHLRQVIEAKLGRGPAAAWSERDFEHASRTLAETTGQLLSVTTLKRLTGRVSFEGRPQLHTLNTLAVFAGYESFGQLQRDLQAEAQPRPAPIPQPAPAEALPIPTTIQVLAQAEARPAKQLWRWWVGGTLLALVALASILWGVLGSRTTAPAKPVASGTLTVEGSSQLALPYPVRLLYQGTPLDTHFLNVIIYEHEAMGYANTNKAGQGVFSHIYSVPGIYYPKLLSERRIVAQTQLLVPSPGWYGQVSQLERLHVLPPLPVGRGLRLQAKPRQLDSLGIDTNRRYMVNYKLVRDFKLSGDAFRFTARVRNRGGKPGMADGFTVFKVKGRQGTFHMQVARDRPLGLYFIQVSEVTLDSARSGPRLKAFRVPLDDWHSVEMSAAGGRFTFKLGGRTLLSQAYRRPIGELYNIEFATVGQGELAEPHLFGSRGEQAL